MSWLNRLTLVRRMQVLGGVCIAIAAAFCHDWASTQWQALQSARTELQGIPAVEAWLKLARLTAEHRGLAAQTLAGNDEHRADREARQAEVDAALGAALSAADTWKSPRMDHLRESLQPQWKDLARAVATRQLSPEESLRRHDALIQAELNVLDEVVSASTLALDPEAGPYHLIMASARLLPATMEYTGQVRGLGATLLGNPSAAPQDKLELAQALEQMQEGWTDADLELQRSEAADGAGGAALAQAITQARDSLDRAVALARGQVLDATAPTLAPADYVAKLDEARAAQSQLDAIAFQMLHALLAQRTHDAMTQTVLAIGCGGLLALGVVVLTIGMVRSVRRSARDAVGVARAIADGDFRVRDLSFSHNEFGQIVRAMDDARASVAEAIDGVRRGVEAMAAASQQIAQGSTDLSQRTEQQAGALQQTAASLEELNGTVRLNSDNANQATGIAHAASDAAARGGEIMDRVAQRMQEIAHSSQRIGTIIGLIDGIAFQTNILALNAAVEAARAGEQGRGFAVVAGEVRQLAQRSAEAAREIKSVIASSVENVERGTELVHEAGRSIGDVVVNVNRMRDLAGEIAAATREQAQGIGQVNDAVATLDQGTQQNAALAEESAAAAASLREQSERVTTAVGIFRLDVIPG